MLFFKLIFQISKVLSEYSKADVLSTLEELRQFDRSSRYICDFLIALFTFLYSIGGSDDE